MDVGRHGAEAHTVSPLDVVALVAAGILAVVSAFLAVADTVFTQVTRVRAEQLAEDGDRAAGALRGQLDRREELLQTIFLLELACDVVVAGVVALVVQRVAGPLGVVVALLVGLPLLFLVAVAWPRTWAHENLERAIRIAVPAARAARVLVPVRIVAMVVLAFVRRVVPEREASRSATEDSFAAVAGSALEVDALGEEGSDLIDTLVAFGSAEVRDVMIPRPDMVALGAAIPLADAVRTAIEEGYSRFPVTGDGIDDVVGIVFAKDLVRAALGAGDAGTVADLTHPALFVPETKRLASLLTEMQQQKMHLAVVVDEYGGTAGLISLEDILEELVGDIADEFDDERPDIEQLGADRVRVAAGVPVDDLDEELRLDLPDGAWETLGGFLIDHFGGVPRTGDQVVLDGRRIIVERVIGRRIRSVVIERVSA